MYINLKRNLFISSVVALFLGMIGCTDDINVPNTIPSEGNAVITFVLSETQAQKIETRAIDDSSIADVHIVVFGSSGQFITKGYYTSNKIKMSLPAGNGYTIYAIANTGTPDFFKSPYYLQNEENFKSMPHYYDKSEPIDINNRLIMSGSLKGVNVVAGVQQSLGFSIERLVAKINLKVTTPSDIKITKYIIKELHTMTYLIARPNANEASASDLQIGDDFDTRYFENPDIKDRFTLNQEVVTSDMSNVTFYMFQNRAGGRVAVDGSVGNLSDQLEKAKYAPSTATYIEIYSTGKNYTSAIHRIYLGADNSQNYNVKRNREYTYNINIKDKLTADTRVDRLESPSNCYIVPVNGRVTFPVSRANEDGVIRLSGSYTAELLWVDNDKGMTASGTVKSVVENVYDGTVTVETGSLMGNAVVAVRDYYGDIVWSWHIWVTDYDPNSANYSYNNGTKIITFMNRNLGALSNAVGGVQSIGLLYQWGRKDPFPSADGVASKIPKVVYDKWGDRVDILNVRIDRTMNNNLEISRKNPNSFYSNVRSPYDWFTYSGARNDDLWGGVSNKKTSYDPCPVGWRVPISGAGSASFWCKPSAKSSTTPSKYTSNKWANGYDFSKLSDNYSIGWYPNIMSYDYYTGNMGEAKTLGTYMEGYYWSALPIGDKTYVFEITKTVVNVANPNGYRAGGCAVRCVKE